MTAQTISNDFAGRHNADLAQSTVRVLQGGTWKKQRIVVLIPAADMIPAKVYLSHLGLIFPPNQPVVRLLCLGDEVGVAYSNAIESVLADPNLSQWEFVLTLEHDNMPPGDGVLKLIERMEAHPEFGCIGGLYWTKGEGGMPQCWGDVNDPILNFRPQPPPAAGDYGEYCGTGMGFNLWRMTMLKDPKLPRPLFKTKASKDGVGTQDLSFWAEARKHGYRCAVDAAVLVGHYDKDQDMVW